MNKEERKAEIEAYYPLVEVVVKALYKDKSFKQLIQFYGDLVGEGALGLIKGVESYDPDKNSSKVSWYSRKIRTEVLNYIKTFENNGRVPVDVCIDDIEIAEEYKEPYEDPDFTLIDQYEPKDEINQAIYHRILMGNATQREIAEEFGVSKKAIEMRKRKLIIRLKKQMENNNVLEEDNV